MRLLIREQEKRSLMCCLDPLTCVLAHNTGEWVKLLCAGGETAGRMDLWNQYCTGRWIQARGTSEIQAMGTSEISVHLTECCREPLCCAVTHRGQGQKPHKAGEGEMQCSKGNPAVSCLSTCARAIPQAQPGDPQGRDLAVTASPGLPWLSWITRLNIKSVL